MTMGASETERMKVGSNERKCHTHSRAVPANKRYFVGLNGIAHNRIGWVYEDCVCACVCLCMHVRECVFVSASFAIFTSIPSSLFGSSWLYICLSIYCASYCVCSGVLRYTSFMSRDIIRLLRSFFFFYFRALSVSALLTCIWVFVLLFYSFFHAFIERRSITHTYTRTHITKL